jgi:phosphoesterase RecJ-like protein
VSVDTASPSQLGALYETYKDKIDLMIDHHGKGTPYADHYISPGSSACGETLYAVLSLYAKRHGGELPQRVNELIYAAVSSDTGCFRYANTTDRSFALASACAMISPDIFRINQALFDTVTMGRLRLQSWVVEHMQVLQGGKIVVCGIPANLQETLGLAEEDMGNLSGFLRSIEGVKMAATVKQDKEGHTGISIRAVPGYNAAEVCEKFGGGGHKGAAGASMENVTLDEAVEKLIAAMPEI